MPIASPRMRRLAESVLGELDLLLDSWADGIDRHSPLSPHSVASINAPISAAQRVVSREAGAGGLRVFAGADPVMPADAVIRLLQARHLLLAFVRHHASLTQGGEIEWHDPPPEILPRRKN